MSAGIVKWLFLYAKVRKGIFWPYFGTFLIHEKSYTHGVFANPSFRYSEKRLSPHMAKFWDINLFTNRRGHEFKNAFTPTCCKFFLPQSKKLCLYFNCTYKGLFQIILYFSNAWGNGEPVDPVECLQPFWSISKHIIIFSLCYCTHLYISYLAPITWVMYNTIRSP